MTAHFPLISVWTWGLWFNSPPLQFSLGWEGVTLVFVHCNQKPLPATNALKSLAISVSWSQSFHRALRALLLSPWAALLFQLLHGTFCSFVVMEVLLRILSTCRAIFIAHFFSSCDNLQTFKSTCHAPMCALALSGYKYICGEILFVL